MLKIFVDSGSSIKQEEKEKYQVELIPLIVNIRDEEYLDGVNLDLDDFYKFLIEEKGFPKTSLPNLVELEERVNKCVENGDDVIILTISSGISSTNSSIKILFEGNPKVKVIDSKMAVGGMRLIVDEINRHKEESLDEIEARVNALIPRIKILAIPETLDYLLRGGRLSKMEWILGSILKIKPIIGFKNGKVTVHSKKIGLANGMKYLANSLQELNYDENYDIVASYTYNKGNLDKLISMTDEKYRDKMVFDNLDPAIASHWGPNAFGYVFVSKE